MQSSIPAFRFSNDTTSRVCFDARTREGHADSPNLDYLIPMDSRVEIDAKIAAGYFTSGKPVTEKDLSKTVGRSWEEADH